MTPGAICVNGNHSGYGRGGSLRIVCFIMPTVMAVHVAAISVTEWDVDLGVLHWSKTFVHFGCPICTYLDMCEWFALIIEINCPPVSS